MWWSFHSISYYMYPGSIEVSFRSHNTAPDLTGDVPAIILWYTTCEEPYKVPYSPKSSFAFIKVHWWKVAYLLVFEWLSRATYMVLRCSLNQFVKSLFALIQGDLSIDHQGILVMIIETVIWSFNIKHMYAVLLRLKAQWPAIIWCQIWWSLASWPFKKKKERKKRKKGKMEWGFWKPYINY